LFDRHIVLPEWLSSRVIDIDERIAASGEVVQPLNGAVARKVFQRTFSQGRRSIAIVLMHGCRYAKHESKLADVAREIGFTQISVLHQLSPLMMLVSQ
jgi:5-oxoprolinase (ATP-hydrolysing)